MTVIVCDVGYEAVLDDNAVRMQNATTEGHQGQVLQIKEGQRRMVGLSLW